MTLDRLCLLLFCSELLATRSASSPDFGLDQPGLGPGAPPRVRYHGSRSPTALVPKGTSYPKRR